MFKNKIIEHKGAKLLNIVLLFSLVLLGSGFTFKKIPKAPNLTIRIVANREAYKVGEPIGIAISIFSNSKESFATFRSAQIFDLSLEKDNQSIWRWSKGKMFAQSIVKKKISPAEPLLFCEILDLSPIKLEPGSYRLLPHLCLNGYQEGPAVNLKIIQD